MPDACAVMDSSWLCRRWFCFSRSFSLASSSAFSPSSLVRSACHCNAACDLALSASAALVRESLTCASAARARLSISLSCLRLSPCATTSRSYASWEDRHCMCCVSTSLLSAVMRASTSATRRSAAAVLSLTAESSPCTCSTRTLPASFSRSRAASASALALVATSSCERATCSASCARLTEASDWALNLSWASVMDLRASSLAAAMALYWAVCPAAAAACSWAVASSCFTA
mmetsp:Transcript_16152/g.50787  ORF Transcript_16152/g.50787 Transcript_16152/m.50787 type:complete len:232 (-) Transcript_16152:3020-3715(-)